MYFFLFIDLSNLDTDSILFLQKAARLLPSTVKYHRSCL